MTNQDAANASQSTAQNMQGAKILDISKITQDASNPCVLENDDIASTLTAPLGIERPEAGELQEIALKPGQNYLFDFNEGEVSSIVESCGDLIMDFENGGQLILTNFSDSIGTDLPPVLAFVGDALVDEDVIAEAGDGEIVDISDIIENSPAEDDLEEPQTSVRETVDVVEADQQPAAMEGETAEELNAEELAAIETAAGEEEMTAEELAGLEPAAGDDGGSAGNSGFGFGSRFEAQGVIPIEDVGPIAPTALEYGLSRPKDDLGLSPQDDRPIISGPDEKTLDETDFDPSVGPHSVSDTINVNFGNDGPGTIAVNGDFAVDGSLLGGNFTSGGQPITFTTTPNGYVGTINGGADTVFDFTLNNNGQYTFNQYLPLDHADGSNPNDVIQLNFGFAATDSDGDVTQSSVTINILDDAPVAIAPDSNTIDEADLTSGDVVINDSLAVNFGNDGPGALTPNGTSDFTGVTTLTSGGVAITITPTADGYIGTLTGGATAFEITIDPISGDYEFVLSVPLDNAPGNDPIILDFGVIAEDFDGDTTESNISITIVDSVPEINDTPTVGAGIENIDETNIPLGGTSVTGSVGVDFGADQPGSIEVSGTPAVSGSSAAGTSLTSGGQPVTITQVGNGYVGTINGGADTVFTFTLDPTNGDYAFEQVLPLDHADSTDPNDVITIEFPVTAEDSDGDTDTGSVVINIADDGPVANDDVNGAEEGQDITGSFVANDVLSQDNDNTVTEVEFNGTSYVVPAGGSVDIDTPLGTLTANSDGTYSFSATDVGDPDGTLTFTYTLTDGDGDSDTADLSIRVTPDGEPVAVSGEMLVDETNLTPGPLTTTGTAVVDFGLDGPGTITPSGTFNASESVAGGTLTSGGQPVTVTATANGYVGTINGGTTTIFTLVITDTTTGDYTFELLGTLDHADNTDPNDTIRLSFGVTAQDSDDDTVDGTIDVLVLDDAPVALDDTNSAIESQTVTGNVLNNDESSEDTPTTVIQISFNGTTVDVLAGGTTVTGTYGTLTINPDGSYSYTANANNPEGSDVFSYVVEDYDGDRETADLTIDVAPIDDAPVIDSGFEVVDETDLDGGNIVVNGTLTVDYGTDGPGTITPVSFDSSGSQLGGTLTSGGEPVTVTLVGDTYTGTTPGGEVIFTMDVNTDGTYEFTLIGTLDHADPNDPNDIINLEFTVNAQDSDDDVTPTTIVVAVKDDVPEIRDSQGDVDETNFDNGPLTYSDTLFTDFGQDVGSIAVGNNAVATVNGTPIALTSNGDAVTITATPTGYEGTTNAGGTTVFTINIDPVTGQYVYTQLETLDHPDGTDANDVIELAFDFDVTSNEGESDTGTVTIAVADDGVDAVDDVNNAEEGQTITGSFVSNDDLSNDVANEVTDITFNGTTTPIPSGGSATIVTPLGTLIANSDGTYSFTATSVGDPDGDVTFTYTLTDGDTDSDTAELTISVTPDGEPQSVNGAQTVDETDLTPGPETVSGAINVDYGLDGAGTVESNGTFTFGQSVANGQLTSSGVPVDVTPTATGYVGTANGQPVFTLTLNPQTLTYDFVLQGTLDHADGTDPNDTIQLNFGVTASDADGDEVDGTITILVVDDAPVAYDDVDSVGENETTITGNVTNNDEASEDLPSTVTSISFNGTDVAVHPVNGATIAGDHGVLTINADGSYTYVSNATNANDEVDVFTYAYSDAEGDTDTAELTINIADVDDEPILADPEPLVVDETDLNPTDTDSDTVVADFGLDGPGTYTVTGAGTFGFTGATNNTLTSNGVAVTVAVVGNSYVGTANGTEVFRLDLNETTGAYEFTLTGTLDHADTTDPNDAIELSFGVTAQDSDDDTDTGTITVQVLDDGPDAIDDVATYEENNGPFTGNVTDNDDLSEDAANTVTQVKFGGTTVDVPADGSDVTISGDHGTLTINNTGEYTYDLNPNAFSNQTTHSFSIDNPPGSSSAGDIKNVDTSYNETTQDFTFSMTVEDSADGFTLAVNDGPNPKGHGGELALFYFDASSGTPVISVYNYNGLNTQTSWQDGSAAGGTQAPDQIINSIANANLFGNITAVDNGDGTVTYTFDVDASAIQGHTPAYGTPGDWTGVEFSDSIGVWLHPISDLTTGYDANGFLTQWDGGSQSWYDTSNQPTETHVTGEECIEDEFTYVLTDGDGDSDEASLDIKVYADDEPILATPDDLVVDETDMNPTDTDSDVVTADFGSDTPGTYEATGAGTFGFAGAANNALTSNGVAVTVAVVGNSYVGTANGAEVFRLDLNETTGAYEFTLTGVLDHADTTDPNDAINLRFGVTARDVDGDTDTGVINVTVLDDGPSIESKAKAIDEDGLVNGPISYTHTLTHDYGQDGAGTIEPTGNFLAKFEMNGQNVPLSANGRPITVTETANGYVGTVPGGEVIFTLTVNNNGQYTYTQFDGIDHPDSSTPDDIIWLKFEVEITDADGDTDTAYIVVDVEDGGPVAVNDTDAAETGETVTGNVITNDNQGPDDPAEVTRINGLDVGNGGRTVQGTYGELTINPDGTYSYTANNNAPDGSVDTFTYRLTDADGDIDTATLEITIDKDDVPVVTDSEKSVDETGGFDTVTGTVNINYGADGPGEACANGTFSSSDPTFTSLGQTINVTNTGTTYTGTAGGRTIFTMTIQPNGSYTFTQHDQIDHPNSNNPNDIVSLNFGVKGVDADGDVGNGTITIDVIDDAPIARNDTDAAEEGETVTGSVIGNDTVGADAPGTISMIDGQNIPAGGKTIVGQFGTLTIQQNGSYSYTANNNNPDGVDIFTYKLVDADGDADTAKLKITVTDDDQPIVARAWDCVDETNGFDTVSGNISVNYGGDGPGATSANGTFNSSDSTLTSLGQTINVTNNGTTYTGTAGGRTIFTMTINSNGTYTFRQIDQIDHPNSSNPDDIVRLDFGVTATDSDGDTGTGLVSVEVHDDGPNARNDVDTAGEGETISGNVITNDTVGADAPGSITHINGQSIGSGGKVINGTYGTLTINQNGSYSYQANNNNPDGIDTFTYRLKDFDGDADTATLKITVSPDDDQPIVANASKTVDETGGFDTVSGNISVNYGGDGPGTTAANGTFSASDSSLTSLGQTVNVTRSGNTYTGTAGGRTIFTMKVNSNGTYEFKQLDQLDHPNASNANDNIALRFGVTATDSDGDTGTGTVTINVRDDGPNAVNDTKSANEGQTVSGNVITNDTVGADAPGKITHINGQAIGSGGKVINGTYGTLTINQNGTYSYKANNNNPDGTDTFTYKLKDYDGDADTATLKITVSPDDDQPIVANASKTVDETGGFDTVSGNISVNYGSDGPGTTMTNGAFSASDSSLTSLGQTINVTNNGTTYTGTAGGRTIFTMKINANGSYTFKQFDQIDHPNASNPNDNVALRFGVKATDSDGDVGNGTVTINVRDDGPDAKNDTKSTKEGKTINGNVMSNDDVGADAPGKITHINGQSIGSGGKTINGTYGKLTINQDGTYSYKANNNNPDGTDTFTYKLKDYDGDVDTATLKINVDPIDSKPTAVDDRVTQAHKTGQYTFEGNLLDNDSFGGDGAGSPKIIAGTGTVNFAHGSLTISANGHWKLTVNPWIVGNHNYHKEYTIQDADGDTSTARLTFTITPLALDLDGDGIELTNVQNGVLFDYDIDGEAEQTAWVEADDGFLVHDLNGDGIINDRSEMFGDLFGFGDGFAHLGSMDSNGDNKISAEDDQWDELQVWQDLNQDGVTDAGELISLDDLNIESIDLNAEATDQTVEGNYISKVSTYTTTDGVTHEIVDAHLNYEELSEEDRAALDLSNYLVEGSDVIYGTEGADEFVFDAITGGVDEIMDFDAGEGDKIDLTGLLGEYDATQDAIDDFVFQSVENGNTVVSVDVTGSGDANNATTIAVLNGVESIDLETAIKTNTDIV